jgi:hypothetical protein
MAAARAPSHGKQPRRPPCRSAGDPGFCEDESTDDKDDASGDGLRESTPPGPAGPPLASEDRLLEGAWYDRFAFSFEGGIIEDFGLAYSHDACLATGQWCPLD